MLRFTSGTLKGKLRIS